MAAFGMLLAALGCAIGGLLTVLGTVLAAFGALFAVSGSFGDAQSVLKTSYVKSIVHGTFVNIWK